MFASWADKFKKSIFKKPYVVNESTTGNCVESRILNQHQTSKRQIQPITSDDASPTLAKKSKYNSNDRVPFITGMPHWLETLSHLNSSNKRRAGNGRTSHASSQPNDTTKESTSNHISRYGNEQTHTGVSQSRPTSSQSRPRLDASTPIVGSSIPSSVNDKYTVNNTSHSSYQLPPSQHKRYAELRSQHTPNNFSPLNPDTPTPPPLSPISKVYDSMFSRSFSTDYSLGTGKFYCSTLHHENEQRDKARYSELLDKFGQNRPTRPTFNAPNTCTSRQSSVIVIDDDTTTFNESTAKSMLLPRHRRPSTASSGSSDVWARLGPPLPRASCQTALRVHPFTNSRQSTVSNTQASSSNTQSSKKNHQDIVIDLTESSKFDKPLNKTISQPIIDLTKSSSSLALTTHTTQRLSQRPSHSEVRSSRSSPVTVDASFIQNLTHKYGQDKREKQRQICEALGSLEIEKKQRKDFQRSESYTQGRNLLRLTRKVPPPIEQVYLSSSEDEECVEEQQKEEVMPVLNQDMEREVSSALQKHPAGEVLVEGFNMRITRANLHSLYALNWLNDEVINYYMQLLNARGGSNGYPRVHCFNTFFYEKLSTVGYSGVRRWTKKIDIFSCDYVMFPVHLGVHWCLCVVDLKTKKITYYDSMRKNNPACLNTTKSYLQEESIDKRKTQFDLTGWTTECRKDIPEQMNGSDCGVFACKYAEYISRNAPITFTQANMPYFRRRLAYEILHTKLL